MGNVVLVIDRAAYILAFLLGAVSVSSRFNTACRSQLKWSLRLAMAATCPMVVSVIADAAVTTLRLLEERPPVSVFLIRCCLLPSRWRPRWFSSWPSGRRCAIRYALHRCCTGSSLSRGRGAHSSDSVVLTDF
jgi:hypothetical protein